MTMVGIFILDADIYDSGGIRTSPPLKRDAQKVLPKISWSKVDDLFLDISSGGYIFSNRFDIARKHINDLCEQDIYKYEKHFFKLVIVL